MHPKKRHILLVDDDIIIDYLHKKILQKAGFNNSITTVYNGKEAIERLLCLNERLDKNDGLLLLLDLNMPILNGWQFLEEFQNIQMQLKYTIDIFILSSSNNPDDINSLKQNPLVKGYLNKPLTLTAVQNELSELIN
ncbi:MAG: hypothetical protein RLZZ500_1773 [Bacteroidota bacterium]|jgi:CheY-like chemotaxis protein